jgi:2-polyprenyl-3-methyl-5-hydroxy-6-metoxy-1,4-benzoquinol methylase
MGSNRNQLVEDYAEHFARLNQSLDLRKVRGSEFVMMDRTFGDLLKNSPPDARILDLGCGVGFLLHWLTRHRGIVATGVDASPTQIEIARQNLPDAEITCADGLEYLRANSESFDGIFCTDVLEHIPGTDACIEWVQTARGALRPGGFFACRGPNGANLTAGYSRYIDLTHERCFTEKSILQLLDAGGLKDARVLPIRAGGFAGNARIWLERWMHRAVYRICGQGDVRQFTYNICAVGFRRD